MKKRMSAVQVASRTKELIVELASLNSASNDVRQQFNEYMDLPQRVREQFASVPMKAVVDRIPGHTLREKAKKMRVSHSTMWNWLHGRRPPRKLAERLSEITGYSVRQIINE